ncbi:MAG: hypothetical protein ACD_37C00253G0003 [uncultured bacterium]|nr:MAG: hypothetical protein ACD_37C00253G0003 [uncultured bacterium]
MTGSDKLTPGEPKTDETADWKTYENENFSFNYPSSLNLKESTGPNGEVSIELEEPNSPLLGFHMYISSDPEISSVLDREFVKEYYDENKNLKGGELDPSLQYLTIEEKTLNGNQVSLIDGLQTLVGYSVSVYLIRNGKNGASADLGHTEFKQGESKASRFKYAEQILSTFKFTN